MRLPLSKVYRAFPELDRFSDEQCERWQRLANQYWPWKQVGVICAAIAAFPLVWTITMVLVTLVGNASGFRPLDHLPGPFGLIVLMLVLAVPILIAAVVSFLIRDWWARRCLRRFIDDRVCACGYSLLGLPEVKHENHVVVNCPECGTQHWLNTRTSFTVPRERV